MKTPHSRLALRLLASATLATAPFACAVRLHAQGNPPTPNLAGKVMTVSGPADPATLGRTLMHEHVLADFTLPIDDPERWIAAGKQKPIGATDVAKYHAPLTLGILADVMLGAPNYDNWLLTDEETAIAEVAAFRQRSGGAVVDVTTIGLRRNPQGLQRISAATGVAIIMGSGWYTAGWRPAALGTRTIESLTDELVQDITVGVDGTGIRPGIIGEIGLGSDPDDADDRRILRASARASRITGAAITLHFPGTARHHGKVLDLLAAEGADLGRVIIGHADYLAGEPAYLRQLLDRHATVQFDMIGEPPLVTRVRPIDSEIAKTIVELVKAGYADRILLSQDVSAKTRLKAFGGTGYSYLEESFLPYLKRLGLTEAQVTQIVVNNPQRLLTFVAPGQEGSRK